MQALRWVDLNVPRGGVCALLGPNGAGKTTAVRVLATLPRPTPAGPVAGHDVVGSRAWCARRSAWPGSTPRWTTTSPAGRTCSSSGSCITWAVAARGHGPMSCWSSSAWPSGRPPGKTWSGGMPPSAGPAGQPDRRPAGAVSRRAEHRPGPAQPGRDLVRHRGSWPRRHDGPADHPVSGRSRSARRSDRDHRRRTGGRARQPGRSSRTPSAAGSMWCWPTRPTCPRPPPSWRASRHGRPHRRRRRRLTAPVAAGA